MQNGKARDRMGGQTKYANHKQNKYQSGGEHDATMKHKSVNTNPGFKPLFSLGTDRMRSDTRYPNRKGGGKQFIPSEQPGEATGYAGTRDGGKSYPSNKKGNSFMIPENTCQQHGVTVVRNSTYAVGGVDSGKSGTNFPGKRAG